MVRGLYVRRSSAAFRCVADAGGCVGSGFTVAMAVGAALGILAGGAAGTISAVGTGGAGVVLWDGDSSVQFLGSGPTVATSMLRESSSESSDGGRNDWALYVQKMGCRGCRFSGFSLRANLVRSNPAVLMTVPVQRATMVEWRRENGDGRETRFSTRRPRTVKAFRSFDPRRMRDVGSAVPRLRLRLSILASASIFRAGIVFGALRRGNHVFLWW